MPVVLDPSDPDQMCIMLLLIKRVFLKQLVIWCEAKWKQRKGYTYIVTIFNFANIYFSIAYYLNTELTG